MVMTSEASSEALISKLYYCCNAVLDQQKRIDDDVSKLKTYIGELRTFVEGLDRRVATLSTSNDHTVGRVDVVELALRTLGENRLEDFGKVNSTMRDIQQDIAGLVDRVAKIDIK
jgi:uncharacterized protein YoxC